MKSILNSILDTLNKYPLATILIILSILTYLYTTKVEKYMDDPNEIEITEKKDGWYLTVTKCYGDPGIRGTEFGDCEEFELSESLNSLSSAQREKEKIVKNMSNELQRIDFLNFHYLGKTFINIPFLFIAFLGIYDIYRKNRIN